MQQQQPTRRKGGGGTRFAIDVAVTCQRVCIYFSGTKYQQQYNYKKSTRVLTNKNHGIIFHDNMHIIPIYIRKRKKQNKTYRT